MSNKIKLFKQKPWKSIGVGNGAFIADFYVDEKNADVEHNYLHIHTPNNVFDQKVVGYPYGYLLAAINQGREEEVHNYCVLLWRVSQEIYQDAGLANDILKAFNKYDKRLMKKAESDAAKVDDATEQASQSFMESVIERYQMSKKEAKKASEEDKAIMRELLNEGKEGEK